jgi:hypothetical protein
MPIAAISQAARAAYPMRRAGDSASAEAARVSAARAGAAQTETASVALVAVEPVPRSAPVTSALARPDSGFVTHLLATFQQEPQTRQLRRAAIADVEAAYRAANQNQTATPMGTFTRKSA